MCAISKEPSFPREEPTTIELAREVNEAIGKVASYLHDLVKKPHITDQTDSLEVMAKNLVELDESSQKTLFQNDESSSLKEALKDAGEIVQNILIQPLSIPGAKKDISFLEAAKAFETKNALTSDLRKILLSFLQFPEPTQRMIEELELLQDDLRP